MEPNNAVAAAVRTMVDAVNSGDFAGAIAAFTEAPVIIEDLAPTSGGVLTRHPTGCRPWERTQHA